jgi:hypothetical protein
MASDAGAQQILDLLNAPSEERRSDGVTISKAVQRAPDRDYGLPPQSGFDAIAAMRQQFRTLRSQIAAVDTGNPAKQDILDALDDLDRCFGALERGLSHGMTERAVRGLNRAEKLGKSAQKGLRAAVKELSA